jgi:hypothetical protein
MGSDKVAVGITTQNRAETVMKTLEAHWKFRSALDMLAIHDDGSEDMTAHRIMNWMSDDPERRVWAEARRLRFTVTGKVHGIAESKNALLRSLMQSNTDHFVIMEDDVRPLYGQWSQVFVAVSQETSVEHLLHLPTKRFGSVRKVEGVVPHEIAWRKFASGMCMYMTRRMVLVTGMFDIRCGRYGYEHNLWSSKAMALLGREPELYPHVVELERANMLESDDAAWWKKGKWGPSSMEYGVELNTDQQRIAFRHKFAHANKELWDSEIQNIRQLYQSVINEAKGGQNAVSADS